jgi:hypothetical protein
MSNVVESSPADMEAYPSNTGAEASNNSSVKAGALADDKVNKVWTLEYDLALLEEVGNYNAHIPEPKEKTKNFESVLVALMNCGIPFKNSRTIVERFSYLKRMLSVKMSKQQSTFGMESFCDEDPLADLMEDLIQEMNDHEALKDEKSKEKQNKKVQLVAGGKALHDKCAMQILNGKGNPIGGDVVVLSDLRESPTLSESTNNTENGSTKKKLLETYSLTIPSLLRTRKKG